MIPVTEATKTALHQAVKQVRARITWNDGDGRTTQEITSEDRIISLKKEAEGYYCKSTLRKITIVLTGTETNLLDQKITATVEVKTGADTWGKIPWGSFSITEAKIDQDKGTSTFTGYGGISILQQREYQPGAITFPTTVGGLSQQLADYFGIQINLEPGIPNIDAPIQEDLWAKISGTTYRDVLEEIAGATGTIAVIGGGDETLDFKLPPISEASETLTEDNLITSKIGENWGVVNSVVLSRQPQNDNIVVVDAESVEQTGQRTDLVIANNQILDKQRETTAQPLLDALDGWEYRNAEIKTEGHAYHEIGDRLDVTINNETYKMVITKSTVIVDGGINETLTSKTPEAVPINYAKSGGISKTVYRTELEVDKQEQRIDSIVSRQNATDASVQEQFTQITQDLTNIVATAQASGGGNIIMNSVGFGKNAEGELTVWQYGDGATTTTVRSQSSPASLNAGAVSGHEIMMTGASTISQDVALTPGEEYTLALRPSKGSIGSATITVGNSTEAATITLEEGTAYAWSQESVKFTPAIGANTVTITATAGTVIEITDLILATGGAITWRQASGEIYNTQVSLDQGGVQVRSSVYTGDYVEITPLEFAGYSNAGGTMQKVFSLNRDTTEVEKLEARSQIKMAPIKVVPIKNASYEGWAFVKEK